QGILETGRRANAQAAFLPVVASCHQHVEVAAQCVSAGRALERCATRIIATQTSDDCGVQIEAAAKGGAIESKLSTIYLDAAPVEEIGMRVGVAPGQADRKVRSDPI